MAKARTGSKSSQQERQAEEMAILEVNKDLLVAIKKAFDGGAKELPPDVKSKLDFVMRDHADVFLPFFVYPVASGQYKPEFAYMVLGEGNKYAILAMKWSEMTARSNYVPKNYGRPEATESIRAFRAKVQTPKGDDLFALAMSLVEQKGLPDVYVQHWVDKTGPFAERPHGREEKKASVVEAIAEMGRRGNPRVDLEARIVQLTAQMNEAKGNDDFDKAKELKAQIADLQAELGKLTDKPETTNPRTDLEARIVQLTAQMNEAKGNDDFDKAKELKAQIADLQAEITAAIKPVETETTTVDGLDEAVAVATSDKAGKGLRLLYGRWDRDELDDAGFIAGARAMGAMK